MRVPITPLLALFQVGKRTPQFQTSIARSYSNEDADRIAAEKYAVYRGSKCLNHLKISQNLWRNILEVANKEKIVCIDATCGNGQDAAFIAQTIGLEETSNQGILWCIDIQPEAITRTKDRLLDILDTDTIDRKVKFVCKSHENLPSDILPNTVSLICYNLGYLPGVQQDVEIKTSLESTYNSIQSALELLKIGGLVSVISYPKHEGGKQETEAVRAIFTNLDHLKWRTYNYYDLNRPVSPSLFVAYKLK